MTPERSTTKQGQTTDGAETATKSGVSGRGPDRDTGMKYGGDDGALEHEGAETNTPEDTGSKVEPGRKAGA